MNKQIEDLLGFIINESTGKFLFYLTGKKIVCIL